MSFKYLFRLIIATYLVFTSESKAQVNIEIKSSGDYSVECNGQSKLFKNTTELSNGLNDFTGNYFRVNSVNLDSEHINTVVFNGINNTFPCTLLIKGNVEIKPNIELLFGNNAHFNELIGRDFNSFSFISNGNTHHIIRNLLATSDTDQQNITAESILINHGKLTFMNSYSNVRCRLNTEQN